MVDAAQIHAVSARIAELFQPQTIILFGSHASGKAAADSDVDLLVVMPFTGDVIDQAVAIRQAIRVQFPLDLLVRTPEQVRERLELNDNFMREIVTRGCVLYEATDA
jgi:predicted nucleotidyltransferase